jgi:hypothetical protein
MTNHMAADHSHDAAATAGAPDTELPRWSVSDVHESFEARSFLDAMDRNAADMARLEALFDELGVRAIEPRPVTEADGRAADAIIDAVNARQADSSITGAVIFAATATDTYDEKALALMGEFDMTDSRMRPLTARAAAWVKALGVDALAEVSEHVATHRGPLLKLAARAQFQMDEAEEGLYAELTVRPPGCSCRPPSPRNSPRRCTCPTARPPNCRWRPCAVWPPTPTPPCAAPPTRPRCRPGRRWRPCALRP